MRLVACRILVIKILEDVEHAALHATGWMIQVIEIKPGSIIQRDRHRTGYILICDAALMPVHQPAQRNNPEAHLIDGLQIRCERQVIIFCVGIIDHIDGVIGKNRDFQFSIQLGRSE